jgi:hypothetical protein
MNWQRTYGKLNEFGSNAWVATVGFLSRRQWLKTPDYHTEYVGQGDFRYRVNRQWCKADPARFPVNNCHEMVMDRQQRLILLTDHPQNNILIFNAAGEVLDSWTLHLTSAHGLTLVNEDDQEYLWICDPYSGQVIKTTLQGQVVQTLPNAHALGIYRSTQFYAPTQTAVAGNGDIYVADGYGSQYVIQFSHDGRYLRHFGGRGTGVQQLDFAHGIAIDNRRGKEQQCVLVTSRRASCIKQFDLEGQYQGTVYLPGAFPCRPVVWNQYVLVGLCWSGGHLRPNSGFVVVLDSNNEVCAALGGHAVRDSQGLLCELVSDYSCFHHVHDVCADVDGNLYACEWNAGKIYPVKLERQG